jgi:hypothetical protein
MTDSGKNKCIVCGEDSSVCSCSDSEKELLAAIAAVPPSAVKAAQADAAGAEKYEKEFAEFLADLDRKEKDAAMVFCVTAAMDAADDDAAAVCAAELKTKGALTTDGARSSEAASAAPQLTGSARLLEDYYAADPLG